MLLRILTSLVFVLTAPMLQAAPSSNTQFIGYLRTTLGASQGPGMPGFGAPGAAAKYRLGNEPDTVLEAGVDHRFEAGATAPADSYLQGVFMLNGFAAIGDSSELSGSGVVQAYVKMSRYLGDFDLWVGRRYYQRKQLDLNDYFWINSGQGAHIGAGIEDLPLGAGSLDFAIFNYEDPDVASLSDPAISGTLHSSLFELRYRDIKLSDSLYLNSLFSATQRPKDQLLAYKNQQGHAVAFWVDMQFSNSKNSVGTILRKGLGIVQAGTNARPIRENSIATGYDLDKAQIFEVNNAYSLYADAYSMEVLALYRKESTGVEGIKGENITWTSGGIRPAYFLSDYTSVAIELGYDRVLNEITDTNGSVAKTTLAFQLTKEKSAGSRPTIRLFGTYSDWSTDFKGLVGGSNYADKTSGWSSGIQTEVWW